MKTYIVIGNKGFGSQIREKVSGRGKQSARNPFNPCKKERKTVALLWKKIRVRTRESNIDEVKHKKVAKFD